MSLTPTLITKGLIEKLDKEFPDIVPRDREITIDGLRFEQGVQYIKNYIQSIYNEERNITPDE
jgi:hypothetical protein